jgi:hypothetical protein
MSEPDDKPAKPATVSWRRPTRRMFVALLGGAAAAIALPNLASPKSPRVQTPAGSGTTRWIGHC